MESTLRTSEIEMSAALTVAREAGDSGTSPPDSARSEVAMGKVSISPIASELSCFVRGLCLHLWIGLQTMSESSYP